MNENTRVKECPHRARNNYALRGTADRDRWQNDCNIQKHPAEYPSPIGIECHLHGNIKLSKCRFYNDWSEKQVKDAFKKLNELEAHREGILGVLRMLRM